MEVNACLMEKKTQIIIVTGYSGAGKSSVLRALEDIGFYCVDNLPMPLISSFFQMIPDFSTRSVALGIDIRSGQALNDFTDMVEHVRKDSSVMLHIVFATASNSVLIKRFQETRRKHPLAGERTLSDAIEHEQKLLEPIRLCADITLHTDQLNIHQLRNEVRTLFSEGNKEQLCVNVISFGFKYGIPHESNFIFDVRSLPNPYFVQELRSFDGTNPVIKEYLFEQKIVQEYWQRLLDFVTYSIDVSSNDGRSFMNIAIGCTGGRHRSVAFAHALSQHAFKHATLVVKHRDKHLEGHQNR